MHPLQSDRFNTSKFFSSHLNCAGWRPSGDDAAYLKLPTRRELSGRRKLFFSVLPAIFTRSCAQGVTDLWPVRGTANRLFLNARKMHSLPSERSRRTGERESNKRTNLITCHNSGRKEERRKREEGKAGIEKEKKEVVLSVVDTLGWDIYFRDGHVSRSRKLSALFLSAEYFTNTVKSLLQGGVQYQSWLALHIQNVAKRGRGKNTSRRRALGKWTIVKLYSPILY